MKLTEPQIFSIANFEGPIDFLWHLINKQEIDIYEIALQQLIKQYDFCHADIDVGAEFIATTAALVCLKSKMLLPKHEQELLDIEEESADPHFEIIHQLVDYCRFKQAAKTLTELEEQQSAFYLRGAEVAPERKKQFGIDHISLEDLASLFQQLLSKTSVQPKTIEEEEWRVADKITMLKQLSRGCSLLKFTEVFTSDKGRVELIVTFLALLELIKLGMLKVIKSASDSCVYIQTVS